MKKEIKITLTTGRVIELTDVEYDELRFGLNSLYPYPLHPHPVEPFPQPYNPPYPPFIPYSTWDTKTSTECTIITHPDGTTTIGSLPNTEGGKGDSK